MNRDSIATYYKDFSPQKATDSFNQARTGLLYYAVMGIKIEHDRQALAVFNPNLNVWKAVKLARSELKTLFLLEMVI